MSIAPATNDDRILKGLFGRRYRKDSHAPRPPRKRAHKLAALELLEGRMLLANFLVSSNADSGTGTLRAAISALNSTGGSSNTITFSLGSTAHTITLASQLPAITKQVDIEGNTVSGFSGPPLVVIAGASAGSGANGLVLGTGSTGSVIQSVVIDGFGSGDGIIVQSNNDSVTGCFVGIDFTGSVAMPNLVGIDITGTGCTTGGTSGGAGNVISGNGTDGVLISSGATALVEGNLIGTNAPGTAAVGNGLDGVEVDGSVSTIGGTTSAAANVISGNVNGIGAGTNCLIEGNLIGTNGSGTAAIANTSAGIVTTGQGATIGGTTSGTANTISGDNIGIDILTSCLVEGNLIGTNEADTAALGNGVGIDGGAPGATIGGITQGAGNVISGNTTYGINVQSGCLIEGNYIGTNSAGASLPNTTGGIDVQLAGATIGGTVGGASNVISGNTGYGVYIQASVLIEDNYIGTNRVGTGALANGSDGIYVAASGATIVANIISGNKTNGIDIEAAVLVQTNDIGTATGGVAAVPNSGDGIYVGATGATIGGTSSAAANIISGNGSNGIDVEASCLVEGNLIGTDSTGSTAVGNNFDGVYVGHAGATIGGITAGTANILSGNGIYGLAIDSSGLVEGNLIGTSSAGTAAVPNIEGGVGVLAAGATIGGSTGGTANTISGNDSDGINIYASCLVEGNLIGTNEAGSAALANTNDGIAVFTAGATIGGTSSAAANVISGNTSIGLYIDASCLVEGNLIGTNSSGTSAVANGTNGINVVATGATIGGTAAGTANVISGNSQSGIDIQASCLVEGNLIGLNKAGTAGVGNGALGVYVVASGATIGGSTAGSGNVISGNGQSGVYLQASALVEGNLVGTNESGTAAVSNGNDGIYVNASGATIGGTSAAAGNVISGNNNDGIDMEATCLVEGDFIGTNEAGSAAVSNRIGIYVNVSGATVGATPSGATNVISGNSYAGVVINAPCLVIGNRIGTNSGGTGAIANAVDGVRVLAAGATIGGITAAAANTISGNLEGIVLVASCLVEGNLIGTNATGSGAVAGALDGIVVGAAGATIGGTTTGAGNLISGNSTTGILAAASCLVEGNLIGTNASDTAAVANGIGIHAGAGTTIGGTSSSAANVISGNTTYGIESEVSCLIEGNLIGANKAGALLPNGTAGILVDTSGATIGGTSSSAANVISGNAEYGIDIEASCLVEGNLIGTNQGGTGALANANAGIYVGASGATIGGTSNGAGDVISGNGVYGIDIHATCVVEGNSIGTNEAQNAAVANATGIYIAAAGETIGGIASGAENIISGNADFGIDIESSCAIIGDVIGLGSGIAVPNAIAGIYVGQAGATIGGTAGGQENFISGNGEYGIDINAPCLVAQNLIGTNVDSDAADPNGIGIFVAASGATIGGTSALAGNFISGNATYGIETNASCLIEGNYIGTNPSALSALPNGVDGIYVAGAGATIGGSTSAASNLISGNGSNGIDIEAACLVEGNVIGLEASIPGNLANGVAGIYVGGSGATIGGVISGTANVISGNTHYGVQLAASCLVEGNLIGTNTAGTAVAANGVAGIYAHGSGATIGGNNSSAANIISGNATYGIDIESACLVEANLIGNNSSGTAVPNATGIYVGQPGSTIGGTATGTVNVIAGNSKDGIDIEASCLVVGNRVGILVAGAALANGIGINVGSGVGSAVATIGGTTSAAANIISGNGAGLDIGGSCVVEGNRIGVNQLETLSVQNTVEGIEVTGPGGTIGGTTAAAANIVAGNNQYGIYVAAPSLIEGNLIGINPSGVVVPNFGPGIYVAQGSATIGGSTSGAGNLISGNAEDGVDIFGACLLEGNYIGTNAAGTSGAGNGGAGIDVAGSGSTIGGTAAGAANLIGGNGTNSINISASCVVEGNLIGTNLAGTGSLGSTGDGILVTGGSATIGGTISGAANTISANTNYGIVIDASCLVEGNLIGTNASGTGALANKDSGILVEGSGGTIGGTTAAAANIIAGNTLYGIDIEAGCLIEGNLIGMNAADTAALANNSGGIYVGGSGGTIGGTTLGSANVIAGNTNDGLDIEASCLVEGNLIGTNAASAALPNSLHGIYVGKPGATIGATSAGGANVISGNSADGIDIAASVLVEGNLIGTNVSGTAALANGVNGIYVGGPGSTIGGSISGAGNTVSGNNSDGIHIAASVLVEGNRIGTNATGTAALPNQGDGIFVASPNATIGGTTSTATNLISGNTSNGVDVESTSCLVEGNLIGTNAAGTAAVANGFDGVYVGAAGATIGGTAGGAGNIVSGNGISGIVTNASCLIEGNLIGTNASGTAAIPNFQLGIDVSASGATIGGSTGGAGNTLSGNTDYGIDIYAPCLVEGNLIGTDATGAVAIPNLLGGVIVWAAGVTIGGVTPCAANTVSGNGQYAIVLEASSLVEGNLMGTSASGSAAIPNAAGGIEVAAPGATIGGIAAGAGNVISGNSGDGIDVMATSSLIEGNRIGTDLTGVNSVPNTGIGIFVESGIPSEVTIGVAGSGNAIAFNGGPGVATTAGTTGVTTRFNSIFENGSTGIDLKNDGVTPNSLNASNNTPVISSAADGVVTGTLNALPNSTYVLDFYTNPSGDATAARPQGRSYVGSMTIATNVQGNAGFSFPYVANALQPFVTVTSTDTAGTTSEFSAPVAAEETASAVTFDATVGTAFYGQVAFFTTTDPVAATSDFTATINFGDGSSSTAGTIVAFDGGFVVMGSHTYTTANLATPVTVTITSTLDFSQTTANSLAVVREPGGSLTAFGTSETFVAGTSSSELVATFTDTEATAFPGQFTAAITWGDASATSVGVVSIDGDGFSVTGTHAYAATGTEPITVAITDLVSGETVTASSTATIVAPSYSVSATGVTLAATTGVPFQGTVASFTTDAPSSTAADFTATINYGDSTSAGGTVVAAPGGFIVVGTHTFTTANPADAVTVTITDTRGYGQATASSVAVVTRPGGVMTPFGQSVTVVAGTLYSVVVAGLSDSNPLAVPSEFSASINWGDGTASSAGIVAVVGAGFSVTGSHTYNVANIYAVTVNITDALTGSTVTAYSTATAAAVPITIQPKNFAVTGGTLFSGAIATFTDGDPRTNPAFYAATINWGDGTPNTTGTITGTNPFTVTASHTFATFPTTDLVTITITDKNGRTSTAVDRVVDPPSVTSPTPTPVTTTAGLEIVCSNLTIAPDRLLQGIVATFTDGGPSEPASAYKATIKWGRGRKSAGMITGTNGRFVVTAKHTFPKFTGKQNVTVTVTDPEGQSVTTSELVSFVVKPPKPLKVRVR
jgi:hypothetical protein